MSAFREGLERYLSADILDRLAQVRVGIAGSGGLGSNCAMHLVRSGFTRLVIADFDAVEPSNLNRQCFSMDQVGRPKVEALMENLRAVNPSVIIDAHFLRINTGNAAAIFGGCDAVVEALDDPAAKKMLTEAILPTGKLLVAVSGIGGYGRADALSTRRVRDNFILIGDGATPCDADTPPLSPMVGMAAAMQADAVLAHFLNQFKERDNG